MMSSSMKNDKSHKKFALLWFDQYLHNQNEEMYPTHELFIIPYVLIMIKRETSTDVG